MATTVSSLRLAAARQAVRVTFHRSMTAERPSVLRPMSVKAAAGGSTSAPAWEIRMLYDSECPLCMREVDMLKRRDAGVGKIDFVDIASEDYRPEDNAGITFEQAMERIHAILPDGSVVQDVEVFRRCYEAVGLGWVYAATKYKPVLDLANKVYGVWAKYRLPVTGRPDLEVVLQKKKMCRAPAAAEAGSSQ